MDIHVNDVINKIYSEYGVPDGYKVGDKNKKDFERNAYYRGLNRISEEEKKTIQVYEITIMKKFGIGIAAARMVLFRLGIFLAETGADHR